MVQEKSETAFPTLSTKALGGLYTHAHQLYIHGKYPESARFFQLLTLLETKKKRNWLGLAAAKQMSCNYQEAVQAYACAALLDPKDPITHLHAAECWVSLNKAKEAKQALASVKHLTQDKKILSRAEALKEAIK